MICGEFALEWMVCPVSDEYTIFSGFWCISEQCFGHAFDRHQLHSRNHGRTISFWERDDTDSSGFPRLAQKGVSWGFLSLTCFLEVTLVILTSLSLVRHWAWKPLAKAGQQGACKAWFKTGITRNWDIFQTIHLCLLIPVLSSMNIPFSVVLRGCSTQDRVFGSCPNDCEGQGNARGALLHLNFNLWSWRLM